MLSSAYAEATAAEVTIAVGDTYSSVYIAVAGKGANADSVVAWPQACYFCTCSRNSRCLSLE